MPSSNTAAAPAWPGKRYIKKLSTYYAPLVLDALKTFGDGHAIAMNGIPATLDTAALADTLGLMYEDAYLCGFHAGVAQVRAAGGKVAAAATGDATVAAESVDWSAWSPGSPAAAALLDAEGDSGGLQALLDNAGVTIKGIEGTTLDTLGNTLADGAREGWSVSQLADEIDAIFDDEARSYMIADTELARSMTEATLASYEDNGISARTWLLSDGACPLCEENEGDGEVALDEDFTNGDPPVHPFCVCAVAPVVPGVDDGTSDDTGD